MATTPCSITVVPPTLPGTSTPQSVSVTISSDRAGASPVTAYTSENGSSAATWPATVATTTTYWLTTEGNYYVSALTPSGQQVARDDYTVEQVACRGAQELRKTVACRVPTDAPTASGTALLADTTFMAGVATSVVNSSTASSRYAPQQRWATGYYYLPGDVRDVLVPTLNQMYAVPMEVWSAALDRIFVEVTSAGTAGSVMRLGVYAPNATTGLPDALLVDAGTIDGTSATGQEKTIALSSLVPGQIVWVTAVAQVAAPTVRALSATNGHPMVGSTTISATIGATVKGAYYSTSTVSGALPATFPMGGSVVKPPMIGLRAA